jgi:hypothetical protein
LNEKMPEIVDETVRTLETVVRDPVQQRSIMRLLVKAAEDWRDGLLVTRIETGTGTLDQRVQLGRSIEHLAERLLGSLEDLETRAALAASLEAWLTGGGQTVGAFLRSIGVRDLELADSLTAKVLSWLTRPQTAELMSRSIADFTLKLLEEKGNASLGEIFKLEPVRKGALDAWLCGRIVKLASENAMNIVEMLDVESIVMDFVVRADAGAAVSSLDRSGASAKWIAVFGALTGFMAGLSQLLLRLVVP